MEVNRSWAGKHDPPHRPEIWVRVFGDALNGARGHSFMIILHEQSSHCLFLPIIVSDSCICSSSLSFRKNRPCVGASVLQGSSIFSFVCPSLFWQKFSLLKFQSIFPLNQRAHHGFVITHIVLLVTNSSTLTCPFLFLPCQCHRLLSGFDLSVHSASRVKSLLPLGLETVVRTV